LLKFKTFAKQLALGKLKVIIKKTTVSSKKSENKIKQSVAKPPFEAIRQFH